MARRSLDRFDENSPLAATVRRLCLADFDGPATTSFDAVAAWQPLLDRGTELWLDTGDANAAAALWCSEFTALTTNNTLLNKEVQKGIYDELVPGAAAAVHEGNPEIDEASAVLEIAFILNAVHGLKLVAQFGAKVSVELHTDLAHDLEASVAYGRRYFSICPSHFIVKVPLTAEGIVAARRLRDDGIPINFTLGFSARQNLLIAAAAQPAYCNVFMGRVNAFFADRGFGDGVNAGERATAASQRTLIELRNAGISDTRQIGASMRGPAQVPSLAGLDVYTMPAPVAAAYLEQALGTSSHGINDDFPVTFVDGVDAGKDGLHVFWDVDAESRAAVDALASQPVADLDGDGVRRILGEHGAASFFPSFTAEELERVSADGKIPEVAPWLSGVHDGRLAWDTMLTIAGLQSFATDQGALDDRIRTVTTG